MLIIINTRSIICMSSPVWPAIFINRCHIRPVTGSVLHLSEPDISLLSVYKILRPVVFIFLLDRIVIRSSIFRCDTKCHSVCYCILICQFFFSIYYRNSCCISYRKIRLQFLHCCWIFLCIRNLYLCSSHFIVRSFQFFIRTCNDCIRYICFSFI